ncbi:hypothetical protein E4U41_000971 [Claviceps citrina]|nr:hypothetical protein E4U41_000971 [Claviceps citrina]
MKPLASLRRGMQRVHLPNPVSRTGRIEGDIRRCLDLVLTCHRDLQLLIHLRNQHLRFLELAPSHVLERVNHVIDTANQGLAEARRVIEKCRPRAHRGGGGMRTSWQSQLEWMVCSAAGFRAQEPLITRQNAAVLAELGYLRHITRPSLPGSSKYSSAVHLSRYSDLPEPLLPDALPCATCSQEKMPLAVSRSPSTCFGAESEDSAPSTTVVLGATTDEKSLLILFGD